jgi:hypothetical protein
MAASFMGKGAGRREREMGPRRQRERIAQKNYCNIFAILQQTLAKKKTMLQFVLHKQYNSDDRSR